MNGYLKLKFITFKRIISNANKHLETIKLHNHSPENACKDEQYPKHIRNIIEGWINLKESTEDSSSSLSQSQKKWKIQDEIIGHRVVLGLNSNGISRGSTQADNRRKGLENVVCYPNLPGALSTINSSKDSPNLVEDNSPGKGTKQKYSKNEIDVKSTIKNHNASKNAISDALTGLAKSLNPQVNDKEMDLKNKVFNHSKLMEEKKMEFDNKRLEMEFSYRNIKLEETSKQNMINLLKLDYSEACNKVCDYKEGDLLHELFYKKKRCLQNVLWFLCSSIIQTIIFKRVVLFFLLPTNSFVFLKVLSYTDQHHFHYTFHYLLHLNIHLWKDLVYYILHLFYFGENMSIYLSLEKY